ncbi:hypothetical protein FBU59_002400, partial [Linderina macrospora]
MFGQRKKKKEKRVRDHRTILEKLEHGFTEEELQEASQDTSTDDEERFRLPEIVTAFTSARLSDASLSPLTEDHSIVDQRRNELKERIESLDNDIDNYDEAQPQANQQQGETSYSLMRQRFLNGPQSSTQPPVQTQPAKQKPSLGLYPAYVTGEIEYPPRRLGKRYFSTQTYDHPNIESPYSTSPEPSIGPGDRAVEEYLQAQYIGEMQDRLSHHNLGTDTESDDSRQRYTTRHTTKYPPESTNNRDQQTEVISRPMETGDFTEERTEELAVASSDDDGQEANTSFKPIMDADDLFGDTYDLSNPRLSEIMRDHAEVFSDLMLSDDSADDDMRPPPSLFASSASVLAEVSKRRHEARRNISAWDGRDATPEVLRQQEVAETEGRSVIERLDKTNSLGMDSLSSDYSGLLPPDEFSPPMRPDNLARVSEDRRQGGAGVIARPMRLTNRAQAANGRIDGGARPPTTPRTFLTRDTKNSPTHRVLRHVTPYDSESEIGGSRRNRPQSGAGGSASTRSRHSTRASAMAAAAAAATSTPVVPDRRNARGTAEFASASTASGSTNHENNAHGLGSLLNDSTPGIEAARAQNQQGGSPHKPISRVLQTPRFSPLRGRNAWNSPMSSNGPYVPFQEPTVDVTLLPRYPEVDLERRSMLDDDILSHADSLSILSRSDLVPTIKYSTSRESGETSQTSLPQLRIDLSATRQDAQPIVMAGDSAESLNQRAKAYEQQYDRIREKPTLDDVFELLKEAMTKGDSQQSTGPAKSEFSLEAIAQLIRQHSAPANLS